MRLNPGWGWSGVQNLRGTRVRPVGGEPSERLTLFDGCALGNVTERFSDLEGRSPVSSVRYVLRSLGTSSTKLVKRPPGREL